MKTAQVFIELASESTSAGLEVASAVFVTVLLTTLIVSLIAGVLHLNGKANRLQQELKRHVNGDK